MGTVLNPAVYMDENVCELIYRDGAFDVSSTTLHYQALVAFDAETLGRCGIFSPEGPVGQYTTSPAPCIPKAKKEATP